MNKQKILEQITVLRQAATQLENQVQNILSYCDYVESIATRIDNVNWGGVALPVAAEDVGALALTCVKRAVKLDTLIMLARLKGID